MQWDPRRSALSHPERHAALLCRSAKLGPTTFGNDRSPARALRQTCSEKEHAGQNCRGTCILSGPAGYCSQVHFLIILEPPATPFRPRSLTSGCPFHIPITGGDLRLEYSPISSRGNFLAAGIQSDWTRSTNAQRAHTACANAPDSSLLFSIFARSVRDTAGFGVFIRPLDRAKPLSACAAAFVSQSRLYPTRAHAFAKCGKYFWNVLPTEKYADLHSAASSDGEKCCRPVVSRKHPQHLMPAAAHFELSSQLRETFTLPVRASRR